VGEGKEICIVLYNMIVLLLLCSINLDLQFIVHDTFLDYMVYSHSQKNRNPKNYKCLGK
jgi:hypothetical protein